MEKLPLKVNRSTRMIRRKRRVAGFNGYYRRFIVFGRRYRAAFIIAGILALAYRYSGYLKSLMGKSSITPFITPPWEARNISRR
jgi:hypothetical protein